MINQQLAQMFYKIADMIYMQGKDAWRPKAYRRAAHSIETCEDLEKIYKKEGLKGLQKISGVGEALAKKIEEYITTGRIKKYDELKSKMPTSIANIIEIPSMGPKKAKRLSDKLKIKTIAQLEKSAKAGKIRKLSGFGEESEKQILEGIALYKARGGKRWSYKEALPIANKIITHLKKVKGVKRVVVAGSIRRKAPTIGDIDILATAKEPEKVTKAFTRFAQVKKILALGQTKASVLLKNNMQADLRVVQDEVYGAALQYFTGPKAFNIKLRQLAIKKGYKLSEYGLFNRKTGKLITAKTEKDIFKKLGLNYIKPDEGVRN